jgi:hypothetical protein
MFAWMKEWNRCESHKSKKGRLCRPWLEVMEDRLAPAILHWSGGGPNTNMSDGGNYVEGPMNGPQAGDTIIFDGINGPNPQKSAVADAGLVANLSAIEFTGGYSGLVTRTAVKAASAA